MKMRKWQSVLLCSLGLLLFLGLSAGILGLSFAGARIVPTEVQGAVLEQSSLPDAEISAYLPGTEMDPTELYQQACRQVVYLYWEHVFDDGSKSRGSGSGIVVSSDGYILTNTHCVADAITLGEPMHVELYDGRTFSATIVGADTETDVALLKADTPWLQAAVLSTEGVKGAQKVYVMGHPSDTLKFSMTSGIVSGLEREVSFDDGVVLKMFQLDAAVNPGNSGGPVFDERGRVVGMVTAKYISLYSEGIGFAIPIEDAVSIAGDLLEYGFVRNRPLLGITAVSVKTDAIEGSPAGVMVHSTAPGLAGERAGLMKGDIIVGIDDKPITSMEDLTRVKRDYRAGDTVRIRFWRLGEYLETELTFDEVTPEHPTGPVTVEEEPEESEEGEETPAEGEEAPEEGEETPAEGEEAPAGEEDASEGDAEAPAEGEAEENP